LCRVARGSDLRKPARIDRLLLAIAVLICILQGYTLSLASLRPQVHLHWKWGMSFLCIGLAALQMAVANVTASLMAWVPITLAVTVEELEPCIPSRKARRKQASVWLSTFEPSPQARAAADHTPLLSVT